QIRSEPSPPAGSALEKVIKLRTDAKSAQNAYQELFDDLPMKPAGKESLQAIIGMRVSDIEARRADLAATKKEMEFLLGNLNLLTAKDSPSEADEYSIRVL